MALCTPSVATNWTLCFRPARPSTFPSTRDLVPGCKDAAGSGFGLGSGLGLGFGSGFGSGSGSGGLGANFVMVAMILSSPSFLTSTPVWAKPASVRTPYFVAVALSESSSVVTPASLTIKLILSPTFKIVASLAPALMVAPVRSVGSPLVMVSMVLPLTASLGM